MPVDPVRHEHRGQTTAPHQLDRATDLVGPTDLTIWPLEILAPRDAQPLGRGAGFTTVFDTDISALFTKRRGFGIVDFLLLAGLIAWTVLASDLRLWVRDGLATFGAATATAGVARADRPAAPIDEVEAVPTEVVVPTDTAENTTAEESAPTPVPFLELMDAGNRAFDAGAFGIARA